MTAMPEGNLIALQYADNFFPSGAIAFSWGLETLVTDGFIRDRETLEAFVRGQLLARWASFDRPFLVAAMAVNADAAYVLDGDVECLSLAQEQRDGSARAGRSLLTVHERLGTAGAAEYRSAIREGRAHGHVPVVQGFLFARLGMAVQAAQEVAAYGLAAGAASAAVRLGVLGSIDAQRTITAVRSDIAAIIATIVPGTKNASAFVPQSEIAIMRHEKQQSRFFAN
jgi:urease accessory protein